MRFSQRIGKRLIKTVLQVEHIDDDLKNRLWNIIIEDFFEKFSDSASYGEESARGNVCKHIWKEFYNRSIDQIPRYSNSNTVYTEGVIVDVRGWFYRVEWFEIYDFIEFVTAIKIGGVAARFILKCNLALKKEVAGYRIVDDKIAQITSEEEVQAIEDASTISEEWKPVNVHLRTALDMLADRKSPDYRNSIKESISAVESLCIIITGDTTATLGKALVEIEKKYAIHKALKTAFSAIYGYTSDTGGIRHALLENDTKVDFEEAKFMLVSCSAFINYLKSKMKI